MAKTTGSDPAQEEVSNEVGEQEIVLANRYRLLVGSPLPEFDLGEASAFVTRDDRNQNDALFARVIPIRCQPRVGIINNLRHMMEANLLRPLEWGPVHWPGARGSHVAVVFKRPHHAPLMAATAEKVNPMQPEELSRMLLAPVVLTLGYMSQRSLTHRGIRPDNLYWSGENRNSIMLGDCLSYAPAALQPALFEPIESAMTPPMARGPGAMRDDFYALGVTTLILALGQRPHQNLSDEQIIQMKLQRGSFSALMAGGRPPFGLRELLRGLLSDASYDRWGLDQLEQWLGGGLRSTVQEIRTGAVERAFSFKGREFLNYRGLAHAFGQDWKMAAKTLDDTAFDKWLRRGVNDSGLADKIRAAFSVGLDSDRVGRAGPRHVAQVCMLLDPYGPIRYKGLVMMPHAIGQALADAYGNGDSESIKVIAECLSSGTALDWYSLKGDTDAIIYEQDIRQVKEMMVLLRHSGPGYGIERCLYMLNPHINCRSAVLGDRYVGNIRDLLTVLDQITAKEGALPTIVDRHLAAFIATRIRANLDRALATLEASQGDATKTKLGMLAIFARLQAKYGPSELLSLTRWLASELEPTVDRLKSRKFRDQLRKRVKALGNSGSLVDLHACLNNDKVILHDEAARKKAMHEFADASREIAQLESREFQDSAQRLGWRIASGISAVVAFAAISVVVLA